MSNPQGVLQEQGYVAGNLGFNKLTEEEKKAIEKEKEEDKK